MGYLDNTRVLENNNNINKYINSVRLDSSPPRVVLGARAIVRVHVQSLPQPGSYVMTTNVWSISICLQQSYHIHFYMEEGGGNGRERERERERERDALYSTWGMD